MATRQINNIKLGLFVIAGITLLIVLLYFIGKNRNLFSPSFSLRTQFKHIQGLQQGNNVRYSGIQAGSVKKIKILNDTVIEVVLSIDKSFKNIIRQNAVVAIGTDGFVGNKIVNITPAKLSAPFVSDQDLLISKKSIESDEMLNTLAETNKNIASISAELNKMVQDLASNKELMHLITSNEIPQSVRNTLRHLNKSVLQLQQASQTINIIADSALTGNGPVASLLRDTSLYDNILNTSIRLKAMSDDASGFINQANQLIAFVSGEITTGNFHTLMRDTAILNSMKQSLKNIEHGTSGFNQNMEALKTNFLFRGYFKKLEKKNK